MKNKVILHLPHASTALPTEFYKNELKLNKEELNQFNLDMTDLFTDELFNAGKYMHINAKYSRIFCDVERFVKDRKEPMAKVGMGMIYSKDINGKDFIKTDKEYKKEVLKNYYQPYHKNLTETIKTELKTNTVIMLDCHSFSNKTIQCFAKLDYVPEICIGFNYLNKKNYKLITTIIYYFQELGYEILMNYPYSGSIVPDKIKEKRTKNFYSVINDIMDNLGITSDDLKC